MPISTPQSHAERGHVKLYARAYVALPDADPTLCAQHAAVFEPAALELDAAFDAHRAAMNDTSAENAALAAADHALDALCERVELTVKLNFGAAGIAELHTLWGHRTRSALTTLPHLQQTTALEELILRLPGAKIVRLEPALLAELEAANDALRAALARRQRAAAAQAACAARLSLAADDFDAAWSRLVKLAGFMLGAEAGRTVPDLGRLRR